MKVREFAEHMGVSIDTVRYWIRTHKLKAKMTPTGYVINEKERERFIETRGKK